MCKWCDVDDSGEGGEAEMVAEGVEQLLDWVSHSIDLGHSVYHIVVALQVAARQAEADFGKHTLN